MELSGNDDLAAYLIQTQLAALKTWSDALNFLLELVPVMKCLWVKML